MLGLTLVVSLIFWIVQRPGIATVPVVPGANASAPPEGGGSAQPSTEGHKHAVGSDATLSPPAAGRAAAQWDFIVRLLGAQRVTDKFATVEFYNNGADDTEASVTRVDADPQRFDLSVNLARSDDPKAQAFTYIHEFAHTISLSDDQLNQVSGSCPRLSMDEGCALPEAYLQTWNATFWQPYGGSAPAADDGSGDKVTQFYEAHSEDFVSEYAATNVTEDFAETFATWITSPEPTGAGVVAEKFRALARHPELRSLRAELRAHLTREGLL